ncbi:MAG: hypothetical protein K2M48_03310, partial [Clostridiales bacterium]|nr:hypothetical protein [Clostridiales bacterium]
FIYVTHDQIEAMTMGTRIVVMEHGDVQQIDTPTNLFDYPVNKFVAGFIGTPQMNFFYITVRRDGNNLIATFADGQSVSFNLKNMRTVREDILDGNEHKVIMGARGESIKIGTSGLAVDVSIKEILGENTHLIVRHSGTEYIVCLNDRVDYSTGEKVYLEFNERKLHLFDNDSRESILGRDFNNAVAEEVAATQEREATTDNAESAEKTSTAKNRAVKKPTEKKTTEKKPTVAKKPSTKPAATKPAAKSTASKQPAAKKPAAEKAPVKKATKPKTPAQTATDEIVEKIAERVAEKVVARTEENKK